MVHENTFISGDEFAGQALLPSIQTKGPSWPIADCPMAGRSPVVSRGRTRLARGDGRGRGPNTIDGRKPVAVCSIPTGLIACPRPAGRRLATPANGRHLKTPLLAVFLREGVGHYPMTTTDH